MYLVRDMDVDIVVEGMGPTYRRLDLGESASACKQGSTPLRVRHWCSSEHKRFSTRFCTVVRHGHHHVCLSSRRHTTIQIERHSKTAGCLSTRLHVKCGEQDVWTTFKKERYRWILIPGRTFLSAGI